MQYAALIELGIIPRSEIKQVKTLAGLLQGHPDMAKTPGMEAVTGSLGQGLSIGVGMALGSASGSDARARVYVIMGDGELSEGQLWEAAMAARRFERGQSHRHRGPEPGPGDRPHRRRSSTFPTSSGSGRPSAGT
ncbi:MAG: hypothetical protein M0C28_23970 [Candidatus Moduliflexus flocculans]|nr:hypothetical protein [Candidatus Moduliflexus flocculans]